MYDELLYVPTMSNDPAADAFEYEMITFVARLNAADADELKALEDEVLRELAAAQRDETEMADYRMGVAVAKAAELGERLEVLAEPEPPIAVPSTWTGKEQDDYGYNPIIHVHGFRGGKVLYWFTPELRESPEDPCQIYQSVELEEFLTWYEPMGFQVRVAIEEEQGTYEQVAWYDTNEEAQEAMAFVQGRDDFQADRTWFWLVEARMPAARKQVSRFKSWESSFDEIPF